MTVEELIKMRPSFAKTKCTFRYAECARHDDTHTADIAIIIVHTALCILRDSTEGQES